MNAAVATGDTGSGRTPLDLPLDRAGTTFIEASAGTGKTYALTTLAARLVIEAGWPIDRILVVTFTRAATAELRDRIRRVLREALVVVKARATAGPDEAPASGTGFGAPAREPIGAAPATHSDDAAGSAESSTPAGSGEGAAVRQARELLGAWERRGGRIDAALARRLDAAIRDIDRANVHTIHGFCQRVLADLAFESQFPFGFEVSAGGGELVAAAVRDFWRRRLYPASMLLMRHAVERGFLPDALAAWVSARRAKTGVEVVGGDSLAEPIEAHEAAWREVFEAVRADWERHRDSFRAEVLEGGWLNRSRYRRERTERELGAMERLFAASEPWLPAEGTAGRYGRRQLSKACKRNATLPPNALFDALDRLEDASREFHAVCDRWLRWARREILTDVRASVRRRIRDERRLAYDDLLVELEEALASGGGTRLAGRIRREFPCTLIDEYQDTDPVQARIFARIHGADRTEPAAEWPENRSAVSGRAGPAPDAGEEAPASVPATATAGNEHGQSGPFIVVGDPKQSIYRFRGADVFAYLGARRMARERLHLGSNWRSVPALVEAVNEVFAGAAPFVVPEIEFRRVAPAASAGTPVPDASGEGGGALKFWLLPRAEGGRSVPKGDANSIVADATAHEIAGLLDPGAGCRATFDGKLLSGADIAVLVRTREQGRLVADALRERGVPGIRIDDASVFHTREAEQMERLLRALAEPARETRVRGALAGDLFGLDARALLGLGDDEALWSEWTERLADWRSHRESKGIGSVLLRILEAEGGATHLLGQRDGTRRLTNVRHLAELLQEAETRERLAPAELAAWLNRRRAESDRRDDSAQLRLESDEQLVRIVTVHGAKGLEFPVVFCPFAWDGRGPQSNAGAVDAQYHLGAADGYREVLDLDPDGRAGAVEWLEEFAESVRLLYVALTRAKYRCVVAWGQVRDAEHAPLAWLLHRPRAGSAETAQCARGSDGASGPGATDALDDAREDGPRAAGPDAAGGAREDGPGAAEPDAAGGAPAGGPGAAEPDAAGGAPAGGPGAAEPDAAVSADGFGVEYPDGALAELAAVADRFLGLSPAQWLAEVDDFARRLPDAISVTVLDPEPPVRSPVLPGDAPPALAARRPVRPLRRIRSLTSFSALAAGISPAAGSPKRPAADPADAEVDRPDHDQREAPADPADDAADASGGGAGRERSVFTFPRGSVAGSCLHRIFERLDMPDALDPEQPDLDEVCREALDDFGFGLEWQSTARDLVERTRAVELRETERDRPEPDGGPDGSSGPGAGTRADADGGPSRRVAPGEGDGAGEGPGDAGTLRTGGFRLGDPHPRLVELDFHFPVDGLDRRRLGAVLEEFGYPDPFAGPGPGAASDPAPPIHGFLRGFVDLVVEHGGRWYVVDYKSNWLGPGPGDYAPAALAEAMRAGGYVLQSLIYLVALHRYLAVRLPEYAYERHVGGAFYLFVRGIDPAAGMARGVWFDRPSAACLRALDTCFRGGGA